MLWLAHIDRDGEPDEDDMTPVGDMGLHPAIVAALKIAGRADFSIYDDPDDEHIRTEVGYHAEEFPNVFFISNTGWWQWWERRSATTTGVTRLGNAPNDLEVQLAPELIRALGPKSQTSVRRRWYPDELKQLPNFADTSYGNDVSDSVAFSIGDTGYTVLIEAARIFERAADARAMEARRFQVMTLVPMFDERDVFLPEQTVEEREIHGGEPLLSTDNPRELVEFFDRLQEQQRQAVVSTQRARGPQRTAFKTLSPEHQFAADVEALFPYNGWRVVYEFPGIYEARHPQGDIVVTWSLDSERPGELFITSREEDDETTIDHKAIPLPRLGRTPEQVLNVVRPWLDRYQPPPEAIDDTAARFGQMEFGPGKGVDVGGGEDDTAKRFAMIELNPRARRGRDNPPRVFRMQKVVGRLEKQPTPTMIRAGMIAKSPGELVRDTLADYMADKPTEIFVVLFLDVRNRIVGFTEYGSGSVSSVMVDAAGLFREALASGAAGVVTAHQHPTGDPTPSAEDRALWARLKAAGELLGVPVVDNLVIGEDGQYFSESEGSVGRVRVLRSAAERSSS